MPKQQREQPGEPGNKRKRMPGDRPEPDSDNPRPVRRDQEEPIQSDQDVDSPRPQRGEGEDRDDMS